MRNKNGEGLMNLSVEYATVNLSLFSPGLEVGPSAWDDGIIS